MENELKIQIVQNLVPVLSANIVVGSVSSAKTVFGDTMTGTGTPTDPVNVSGNILSQISNNTQSIQDSASQIADIESVIPSTASSQNQLADQGFVNSSIQTATAYFRGDWATWADVPSDPSLYPADATGNHTPITNDYMVVIADEQENGGTWRYKYTGVWSEQGKSGWMPEYQVNETPFTAAQNAAINSGVTAQAVADIAAMKTGKQDKLTAGTGITIDGNTISASGGGGDYLPLAGGMMTGDLGIEYSKRIVFDKGSGLGESGDVFFEHKGTGRGLAIGYVARYDDGVAYAYDTNFYFIVSRGLTTEFYSTKSAATLGRSGNKWATIYVTKMNNGADLAVPTTGGTLARVEDIDAVVGDISTALTAILGE